MANAKHEDAVMKMGFDYFRNTILKTLGIDYQYEEIGPTELVELTIQSLYMDFTFLTTGGFYIHTEFQTTDKKKKRICEDSMHMMQYIPIRQGRKLLLTSFITAGLRM